MIIFASDNFWGYLIVTSFALWPETLISENLPTEFEFSMIFQIPLLTFKIYQEILFTNGAVQKLGNANFGPF